MRGRSYLMATVLARSPLHRRFMSSSRRRSMRASSLLLCMWLWLLSSVLTSRWPEFASVDCSSRRPSNSTDSSCVVQTKKSVLRELNEILHQHVALFQQQQQVNKRGVDLNDELQQAQQFIDVLHKSGVVSIALGVSDIWALSPRRFHFPILVLRAFLFSKGI